mmetsp:Transcript_99645/g.177385  ORF Transcript_99645/g.177385 Transcript_99645/m.177385 type:complete len:210 (+) Transcript_99645:1338-1967(+)
MAECLWSHVTHSPNDLERLLLCRTAMSEIKENKVCFRAEASESQSFHFHVTVDNAKTVDMLQSGQQLMHDMLTEAGSDRSMLLQMGKKFRSSQLLHDDVHHGRCHEEIHVANNVWMSLSLGGEFQEAPIAFGMVLKVSISHFVPRNVLHYTHASSSSVLANFDHTKGSTTNLRPQIIQVRNPLGSSAWHGNLPCAGVQSQALASQASRP